MRIRLAELHEAAIVHDVMVRAFREYAAFANPSSALRETVDDVRASMVRGGALLAFSGDGPDGRAVGSVRFHAESELELLRLAVLPELRGSGVGSALVAHVETIARERGYAAVRVYARSQQPDNRPWWLARGYEVDGHSERYGIADLRTHMLKPMR